MANSLRKHGCFIETLAYYKWTAEDITRFKAIRQYRQAAAKLYKLDKTPAYKIHELRDRLPSERMETVQLVSHKYTGQWIIRRDTPRLNVLRMLRQRIQDVRYQNKETQGEINERGFNSEEKIHKEPNGILNWFVKRMLEKPKKPTSKARHIGIEIEYTVPANANYSELQKWVSQISLIADGSIRVDVKGYKPEELRLLTTVENYQNDVTEICGILKDMKAIVNESCGLHVHLDMRDVPLDMIKQRYTNLVRSQKYLQGLVTEKRRQNHYCKPTRGVDPYGSHGRYWAINGAALSEHNTIEVRLHHSTIVADEINNWVRLLLQIVDAKGFKRTPSTLEDFMRKIDMPTPLRQYIVDKTASNSPVSEIEDIETPAPITVTAEGTLLQNITNYTQRLANGSVFYQGQGTAQGQMLGNTGNQMVYTGGFDPSIQRSI